MSRWSEELQAQETVCTKAQMCLGLGLMSTVAGDGGEGIGCKEHGPPDVRGGSGRTTMGLECSFRKLLFQLQTTV